VALAAGAPNPFVSATTLRFVLPRAAHARLAIVDARGGVVRVLLDAPAAAGAHALAWDGRAGNGRSAAPGLYFARLTADGASATQKLVRAR
jgi:flagellar hook assembly protein FlgD